MTPFFSVIVVTYNAGEKLKPTVDSILAQTFADFEIVIKDAGSTDGSLKTLPEDPRIHIYSGKDHGIYDGMNIAVGKAAGKFLYFLNTGDNLKDTGILEQVHEAILGELPEGEVSSPKLVLYGDIFERTSGQVAAAKPVMDDFALFRNVPNHQACFYSRDLFKDRGFDVGLKVRGDYEHFLYCHYIAGAKMVYLPITIADYEGGGFSETKSSREISREEHKMVTQMYMPMSKVLLYRAYLVVTLQPVREKIAQNPSTAAAYDFVKKRVYHR